jgi:Xaa-Pro aminopeptidase
VSIAERTALVPRELLERRWQATARAMEAVGLDAIVVAGRGLIGQYGDVFYLTGFPLFNSVGHGYAFMRRDEPVQLVVGKRDQELAPRFAVEDLVWRASLPDAPALGDIGLVDELCALLDKHGLSRGRIGIVGLDLVMPAGDWILLQRRAPDAEFANARDLLAPIKAVKAPEELELYRAGCEIADAGFETYLEAVAVGRSESELAAAVEATVRKRGALATIVHVLTGRMYTRPPTPRPLAANQLVTCYVEVVAPNGYWVEKGGMFALGEPGVRWLAVYDAIERAFVLGEEMLTAGTRASEIVAMVDRVAREAGCERGIWSGHGVGVDHDRPLLNGTDETPLEAGMVISFHPHLCDDRHGANVIDQYTITETTPLRHSRFPRRLHRV